jgi:transmembrane sensor
MTSVNQQIDDSAALWATQRDLRDPTPEEQRGFEVWLTADIRHLGAYARAEAVLARLERAKGRAVVPQTTVVTAEPRFWTSRRAVLAAGAAAASGVAAVWGTWALAPGALVQSLREEELFSTAVGQVKEVVLSDGSVVSLNTDTQVSVQFTKTHRNLRLIRGEALFDVAKNKKRPFTVIAGDTEVKAVGTSFSVSALPQRPVQVLIREGVVELQRTDIPLSTPVRAGANIHVSAPEGAPMVTQAIPQKQVANQLAWQFGRISLDNQTLAEAASEFSRYSDVRMIIDPAIADKTVTGLFASNDPVGFARAAAGVLKLQAKINGQEIRITKN